MNSVVFIGMSKKVRLTERELLSLVRRIVEQSEDDSYYKISAKEYEELMKLSGYHGNGVTRLPKFQGKPLYIEGDVNLSDTGVESLGNVAVINGSLNISRTNVKSIGDTKVTRYVSDTNSPRERIRIKKELESKLASMNVLRANDEWNIDGDIDDIGIKANALYDHLTSEGNLDGDENDVYVISPLPYKHYGLDMFEVLDGRRDEEYAVGTSDELDRAASDYAEQYLEEVGVDGFREGYIDDYIDTDYVREYFEDWMRDDIYSNPEVYFNRNDYQYTTDQERRRDEIESEIEDLSRQQNELDDNREDYDELYDDFQDKIDELEDERDSMEPEMTDDMVEEKLEELLDDIVRNPKQYIRDYGLDLKNFIDEKALAEGIAEDDGWALISTYDGDWDLGLRYGNEDYYVIRLT